MTAYQYILDLVPVCTMLWGMTNWLVSKISIGCGAIALCAWLGGCGSDADQVDIWSNSPNGPSDDGSQDSGVEANATSPDDPTADASQDEQSSPDDADSGTDGSITDLTVAVSHKRELRGAWVATVFRLQWPKASTADEQKSEMEAILDAAQSTGINTIFFQVRPEADALYDSKLEPWSRFLTGTQGNSPGYDPLQYVIDGCRRRGLEVHAWLNPYRAQASTNVTTAANHVTKTIPEAIVSYGDFKWLDPGHPKAIEHTLNVIKDILSRYDIDGLHFDDYFYPYPESGIKFGDSKTYDTYGGGKSLGDWRRDNVNRMVQSVSDAVKSLRPDVRWGISPFGIYRPGQPPGVTGLDQYDSLYADPVKWLQQGWVEYVAPQLYWPTTSSGQPYIKLLTWWDEQASVTGKMVVPGNSAERGWENSEYREQMKAVRDPALKATHGEIWWSIRSIRDNVKGLASMIKSEFYNTPAASPRIIDSPDTMPQPPVVQMNEGTAKVTSSPENMRYWAVYRQDGAEWTISRLVPAQNTEFLLADGKWAISVIDRSGRESRGVVVQGKGSEPVDPGGNSCTHTNGGIYVNMGCSPSYQCCDGAWKSRGTCGACVCEESSGEIGCGT